MNFIYANDMSFSKRNLLSLQKYQED